MDLLKCCVVLSDGELSAVIGVLVVFAERHTDHQSLLMTNCFLNLQHKYSGCGDLIWHF